MAFAPFLLPDLWKFLQATIGWYGVLVFFLLLWACFGLMFVHYVTLGIGWGRNRIGRLARNQPSPSRHLAASDLPERPLDPVEASLGFVVAVYNDALTIGPCIESLLRQSRAPSEIVVVNDGSTDGTREAVEAFRDRGITIVHLAENGGKKHAVEVGVRHIRTDLVAITDADCIVHDDYAKEIVESFRDPEVAAVSGIGESIPHTPVTAARQVEYMFFYGVCQPAESRTDSILVLVGNCTTYRREVLLEVGFDHPTMSEDISATFRLHQMGRKMRLNRRAKVYVSDPPTVGAYWRQLVRWYTDFWICIRTYPRVFGRKNFGRFELPHVLMHMLAMSSFFIAFPLLLLVFDPPRIVGWIIVNMAVDLLIVAIAYGIYRRKDLWAAVLTRPLTRTVGHTVFLLCMVRVFTNTHGMSWKKLERRPTAQALARSLQPRAIGTAPRR